MESTYEICLMKEFELRGIEALNKVNHQLLIRVINWIRIIE